MKKAGRIFLMLFVFAILITSAVMLAACDPIYEVNFDTDGGTAVEPAFGSFGRVNIDTEPVTAREGYDFMGWYENPDFSGERVSFPATITSFSKPSKAVIHVAYNTITTLYAKWSPQEAAE